MRHEDNSMTGPHPAMIALIVSIGAISINAPLVGAPALQSEFGLPNGAAARVLASFGFGYGIGHLAIGVLATRIEWRVLLAVSLFGYVLSTVFVASASSIDVFQYSRVAQGIFAAAAPIVGRALVSRVTNELRATKLFSGAFALFAWAPVLAPLIAGYLVDAYSWRAIFIGLLAYAIFVTAIIIWRSPPTLRFRPNAEEKFTESFVALINNRRQRRGVMATIGAFTCFFTTLSVSDQFSLDTLETSIVVTGLAASYATGGVLSRIALSWFRPQLVLVVLSVFLLTSAVTYLVLILGHSDGGRVLLVAAMLSLIAGAISPQTTFQSMGKNAASAPLALALLGAGKMMFSTAAAATLIAFSGNSLLISGITCSTCAAVVLLSNIRERVV